MRPVMRAVPIEPSALSLDAVDRASARIRSDEAALSDWTDGYLRQHRMRFASELDLVDRCLAPGSQILDVGAAPFAITAALADRGFRLVAVDIDPNRFAGPVEDLGLEVHACDIEREALPFESDSLDAVLFNELFEHLRIDPIHTLSEVYRVLKPGGLLLLSTPNLRSFRGLKNLLLRDQAFAVSGGVYRQFEKLRTLGHMGHVREYTATEATEFLQQIGFTVEELVYRGGYGRGLGGLAERFAPAFRPFFSAVARRPADSSSAVRS